LLPKNAGYLIDAAVNGKGFVQKNTEKKWRAGVLFKLEFKLKGKQIYTVLPAVQAEQAENS
jgi:hypothetical protein